MSGAVYLIAAAVILALVACFADALAGLAVYVARKVVERKP